MINPNVMQAVGEAFATHQIIARPNEQMADTVARALHVSPNEADRWLEALTDGCTVEEANRRAGIFSHPGNEPLLNTLARHIGAALGSITPSSHPRN
jgi:hypothetical protein